VTIPADSTQTLPAEVDPNGAIEAWITAQIEHWLGEGIDLSRIYFDPGIGFGKNSLQSLAILRHARELRRHGLRVLVGHSRKSFMGSFAPQSAQARDLTTIGASLNLIAQGVDVLRVHDVQAHASAYLGWAHLST
jgi:2-amino-4-hydroxy-6-hydroxymethyldihydropteridine diphosphokinase / dihydropteroate synthase